jgi:hypothetical protein
VASPLKVGNGLAAETQALQERLVTVTGCSLEVIKQLTAAGNHLQKATAGAVVLAVRGQMHSQFIDAPSQDRDLDIGAAGVFGVEFEFCGAGSSFAHGLFGEPDTLSGGLGMFKLGAAKEPPKSTLARSFSQEPSVFARDPRNHTAFEANFDSNHLIWQSHQPVPTPRQDLRHGQRPRLPAICPR